MAKSAVELNLTSLFSSITLHDETNILILGETGVGKSTFINSFANYLAFSSMEEAEANETICLIPTKFTVTDENYEPLQVVFGSHKNESDVVGESKTQGSRCYNFKVGNKILRLIDTPGVGDTRGIEYDRKNFDNILKFISVFSSLQGIIILFKPNNSRLSIPFRFCIQELLCHLHKDASKNIVFVFTHSRETSYRPGETGPILKKMLAEIRNKEPFVDIPLSRETMYCTDSESFRFLLAIKSNIVFDEDQKQSFILSWKTSVKECHRLLLYISRLVPHAISDTTSLNRARAQIIALAKPLNDITQNIQENLKRLNEHKLKIQNAGDDINKLKKTLYVPTVELVLKEFDKPRTVCASPSCYKTYTIEGIRKNDYTQICHDPCSLDNVAADIINNAELKKCAAIETSTGNCYHCKCSWAKHMHIYYKYDHVTKNIVDTGVQDKISSQEAVKNNAMNKLREVEKRVKALEEEQKKITKISAEFTCFLKKNSITPYNDAQLQYMEYLIENEENQMGADPSKKDLVKHLKKQREEYKKELELLSSTFNSSGKKTLTTNYVERLFDQLYNLPINGKNLKSMSNIIQTSQLSELRDHGDVFGPWNRKTKASSFKDGSTEFCVLS